MNNQDALGDEQVCVKCPDCGTTWDTKRQPHNECPVCGKPTSSPLGRQKELDAEGKPLPPTCEMCGQWMFRKEVQERYAAKLNRELNTEAANPTPVSAGGEEFIRGFKEGVKACIGTLAYHRGLKVTRKIMEELKPEVTHDTPK